MMMPQVFGVGALKVSARRRKPSSACVCTMTKLAWQADLLDERRRPTCA